MRAVQKRQIWGCLTHVTVHHFRPWIYLFCTDQVLKYFDLKFCTHVGSILTYMHIFFRIFWTIKFLNFSKIKTSMAPGSQSAILLKAGIYNYIRASTVGFDKFGPSNACRPACTNWSSSNCVIHVHVSHIWSSISILNHATSIKTT